MCQVPLISDTKSAGHESIREFVPAMSDFPRRRWLCVREDFRNGVIPYFGQYLFFFQARIALKLHQRKHPDTERYLSSLNMLELRSDHRREFRSRAIRSILLPGNERSQLFLRVQHWRLVEARLCLLYLPWHDVFHQEPGRPLPGQGVFYFR